MDLRGQALQNQAQEEDQAPGDPPPGDFLGFLVARSLGLGRVVQPRPISRFELPSEAGGLSLPTAVDLEATHDASLSTPMEFEAGSTAPVPIERFVIPPPPGLRFGLPPSQTQPMPADSHANPLQRSRRVTDLPPAVASELSREVEPTLPAEAPASVAPNPPPTSQVRRGGDGPSLESTRRRPGPERPRQPAPASAVTQARPSPGGDETAGGPGAGLETARSPRPSEPRSQRAPSARPVVVELTTGPHAPAPAGARGGKSDQVTRPPGVSESASPAVELARPRPWVKRTTTTAETGSTQLTPVRSRGEFEAQDQAEQPIIRQVAVERTAALSPSPLTEAPSPADASRIESRPPSAADAPSPGPSAPRTAVARPLVTPGIRPYSPPASPRLAAPWGTPEPTPTVNVTIGRVEVRATPPPVAPAKKEGSRPPVMSLEEYLRQRNQGGHQ